MTVATKQTITKKLAVPSDGVRDAVRSFGKLDRSFPSMEACWIDGTGVGAVRHLTPVAGTATTADRLIASDGRPQAV